MPLLFQGYSSASVLSLTLHVPCSINWRFTVQRKVCKAAPNQCKQIALTCYLQSLINRTESPQISRHHIIRIIYELHTSSTRFARIASTTSRPKRLTMLFKSSELVLLLPIIMATNSFSRMRKVRSLLTELGKN